MEVACKHNQIIRLFIFQLFLGLKFFLQDYTKTFKNKIKNVINIYQNLFENKRILKFTTTYGVMFKSFIELTAGCLFVIGLFKFCGLNLLGINLLLSSTAFRVITLIWNMRFIFERILLLNFLFIFLISCHTFFT